ncbi:MAG: hypothetical protein LUE93_05950, partial [Bacteroides sp.]|nr:hypothetical protein [Bacteroides sp.]
MTKRILCFMVIALGMGWKLFCQNTVEYVYDAMGNQIGRRVSTTRITSASLPEKSTSDKYIKKYGDHEIRITPDPASGKALVSISGNIEGLNPEITLYTPDNHVLLQFILIGNETIADFSQQPDGDYLLQLSIGKEVFTWIISK